MPHGHSAIDSLIALTALRKYQAGGEVSPTWGEKFVKMFPSKHKDPERAAEQQRALTDVIDFFAPQSAAEAGLMLAAGPVLGKVAKASRGPLKKLYRGVEKWHRGKMVKGGRHVSPERYPHHSYRIPSTGPNPSKKGVWATDEMEIAEGFADTFGDKSGYVLEYAVPRKFYDKAATKWSDPSSPIFGIPDWIEGGIPKEYLKKVHKGYQEGGQVLQIPQKKELDIVWPVDGESPEDMEQAKYNPVTELLLEALLDKVRRQQRQQRKPGKGLDPEAVKLYTIAQPDVV